MSNSIKIFHTPEEIRQWRRTTRGTIGFVPTMGALHTGHATLLEKIRPRCENSVLSIFVNPMQFGPREDLAQYPRTLEQDLSIAKRCGVDVVYTPSPEVMYPKGFSTSVDETELTQPLCGPFRPGHFRGVTTVVLKLFNLIQPQLAFFGLKDAQQFFVLNKMVHDLDLDIVIEGISTVREPDGLAMSSRNAYLSPADRRKAPRIQETLSQITTALKLGEPISKVLEQGSAVLTQSGFDVQYLECLQLPDLKRAVEIEPKTPYLIATASYLNGTRLIDNIFLNASELERLGIKTQ